MREERKQVVYQGNPLEVYYLAMPHDVGYFWKFWNETGD